MCVTGLCIDIHICIYIYIAVHESIDNNIYQRDFTVEEINSKKHITIMTKLKSSSMNIEIFDE